MMMKLKTIQEMQRKQHRKTASMIAEDSMPASILHPSSTSSKGNTDGTSSNLTHPSAIQLAIVSDLSKAQRISNENDMVRRKMSNGKKVIYLS